MSAVPATKERIMSDDGRPDGRAFLPFPLQDQVPAELREVLCEFVWDSAKLQRLPLPVGTATIDSLRWHLDLPYWRHDGQPFQVTPSQVRADPVRFREHYERTMAADLGCPLDLLFRNGRWVILDGVHRLLKADLLGLDNVQVRRLPAAMLPLILQGAT
jgi:hypothetical protein